MIFTYGFLLYALCIRLFFRSDQILTADKKHPWIGGVFSIWLLDDTGNGGRPPLCPSPAIDRLDHLEVHRKAEQGIEHKK
jgi:hypothetical protein